MIVGHGHGPQRYFWTNLRKPIPREQRLTQPLGGVGKRYRDNDTSDNEKVVVLVADDEETLSVLWWLVRTPTTNERQAGRLTAMGSAWEELRSRAAFAVRLVRC